MPACATTPKTTDVCITCPRVQPVTRYNVTRGQDIRKLLTIHPDPINPQTDIHSTAHFQFCIRKVETRHDGRDYLDEVTCIHKPDGTTPYTLPVDRLRMLHSTSRLHCAKSLKVKSEKSG
jgi:hypothetical protein